MADSKSTKKSAPWLHQKSGLWCVTRKGRRYYLGKTEAEAKRRAARYQKSIERGLKIPELGADPKEDSAAEPTVKNVLLTFLKAQKIRMENGELSSRSLSDYASTCRGFAKFVGDEAWVADLKPDDFTEYRADFSKRRNLVGTENEVTRVKTAFKWAYDYDLLAKPVKFGPEFVRPKKSSIKLLKRAQGKTAFTAP